MRAKLVNQIEVECLSDKTIAHVIGSLFSRFLSIPREMQQEQCEDNDCDYGNFERQDFAVCLTRETRV